MRERQDVEERSSQTHSTWQHEERTRWGSQATLTAPRSQLIGQGGSQHVLPYRVRRRWATAFSATEKTKKKPRQSIPEQKGELRLKTAQTLPASACCFPAERRPSAFPTAVRGDGGGGATGPLIIRAEASRCYFLSWQLVQRLQQICSCHTVTGGFLEQTQAEKNLIRTDMGWSF